MSDLNNEVLQMANAMGENEGAVVRLLKERCADPSEAVYTCCLALAHLYFGAPAFARPLVVEAVRDLLDQLETVEAERRAEP